MSPIPPRQQPPPETSWIAVVLGTLLAIGVVLMVVGLCSCSTVHQAAVAPAAPGFEAKPIRSGNVFIVDDAFRERYNALVDVYGASKFENGSPRFVPTLRHDAGISPGPTAHSWNMTAEALENLIVLEGLTRRGAAP